MFVGGIHDFGGISDWHVLVSVIFTREKGKDMNRIREVRGNGERGEGEKR